MADWAKRRSQENQLLQKNVSVRVSEALSGKQKRFNPKGERVTG